ncbi:DUF3097 family protein [Williamsia sp. CHRR-6]|uniref:DUF3097 family protein n=1 Tax=Williamsia sp. CHRR-6 TaxID=2835871 RepID=UPI001BDB2C3D|nr:DUF3097 family protein [Williamsia sp. CHRR-6]MBT0568072.1 DUF3097 family protein [Williamsia sp. CHRR-6]
MSVSRGDDRYGSDVLASRARRRVPAAATVPAERGLVVEDAVSGFCGAVVGFERGYDGEHVRLEDRAGRTRIFAMREAAFLIDGVPTTLTRPTVVSAPARRLTASGSVAAPVRRARTARASRIFVEGVHDAALVERIWGDDLRAEGVVVCSLDGLDNLAQVMAEFAPAPHRRAGILVDHLVADSKESRLTAGLGPHVLVCGHPFVDVWEAVKPERVGITAWPTVPRSEEWKAGVCRRLGWGSPQDGWRHIYGRVSDFRDVRVELLRSVEELIDFVTSVDTDSGR